MQSHKPMMFTLLQVGACVVSQYKQVMSVGYNAFPTDMIEDVIQENPDQGNYEYS